MILSVGEILIDSYNEKSTTSIHLGGAPFNVAVWAKRAGANVGFVGKVGGDEYGCFIKEKSMDFDLDYVNISVAKGLKTTIAEVTVDGFGERSFKFFRDNTADYQLSENDVDLKGFNGGILHLGTLMLSKDLGRKFAMDILAKARTNNMRISVDVNFRDDLFESKSERNLAIKPYIESADFLKMGLDEILDYTGKTNLENAVKSMPYKQVLFVTDGANGSHVFFENLHEFIPAKMVDPIDTTGAGDAFWGTVLAGIDNLTKNGAPLTMKNLSIIAENANLAGANAVLHKGAI